MWDEPHDDYLYTDAWVKKLIKDLADLEKFEEVTGKAAKPLPDAVERATPAARAA